MVWHRWEYRHRTFTCGEGEGIANFSKRKRVVLGYPQNNGMQNILVAPNSKPLHLYEMDAS